MKKIFLLLLICGAGASVFAQVQRKVTKDTSATATGLQNKKGNKKREMADLNLTKEQKGKMKEMAQENKAAKDAITNDETLTEEQKNAKLKTIKKGNAKTMQGILTPEQKQKLREKRKQKNAEN